MGARMRYNPLPRWQQECLECKPEEIVVFGVDTDISMHTTVVLMHPVQHVTGQAVVKTCESFVRKSVNAEQSISDVSRKM